MSVLVAIAITTGILSALWGWVSVTLGLLTWAGFLGCTSYFASPQDGVKGLATSMITNMSGVFWAMVIIQLSTIAGAEVVGYVITGVVATLMCVQAKQSWLGYIPGTFVGCCATFAAGGDWMAVVPALLVGGLFGFLMKSTGLWLHQKVNQGRAELETAESK
ncbi:MULTISPECIES: DUF1097 domain-containing protein [Ferrimonas]|uniref:DUF1097 domain-containing protein n=1 Tax=Ferrimonas TaxID=44011 RepID=UPI000419561B|nr:DUF1097 domain-containing protein [Ferrimonas futtsuensis]